VSVSVAFLLRKAVICVIDTFFIPQQKLIDGKTAYIDPRYKKRSYAEQQLVKALEQCWEYKPDDRPSIFELVDQLRKAVSENIRMKGPGVEEVLPIEYDSDIDDEDESDASDREANQS
jgi:hypothetical protein